MMSQLRLLKNVHNEICKGRIFVNHICKECGQPVEIEKMEGHIEIGVSDKIPLKGQ